MFIDYFLKVYYMISHISAIDEININLRRLLDEEKAFVERIIAELRFAESLAQQTNKADWAQLVGQRPMPHWQRWQLVAI